ncbi:unnamed protein product [Arabis nemorensis]|uniref:SAM-dependent MTase RsmB/NOP-type domain-containing protein n=1 Tax=Arabis nemorensis TaxID=586526 RepID=A0A565BBC2_9BRAS|nr:unnamed protein product [Arabis nemorensis]
MLISKDLQQTKRMCTANLIVTNNEGQQFPACRLNKSRASEKGNSGMVNGLHSLQGLSLLKVGGKMIYSTCSMNPVEDEAIVAEVLVLNSNMVLSHNTPNQTISCLFPF